ncbi:MAG: exopolysaccharide biosynthesis polyprenyl glycosylphosphotransferase [Solirubrobacterales bacterium]|nr:exopolysaccharide biosynthesis polyprenyl glycosylphosphotransferase [Solirubrobacterales bacterium]
MRALQAQRLIDLLALRLAPAIAAGLIAYSHLGAVGHGLIVFASVFFIAQAIDRADLPLHLMRASRVLLGLAAPAVGAGFVWLISLASGTDYPLAEFEAVVLGASLVLALGAWIKARIEPSLRARVAVIGSRDLAADLAAELDAAGVQSYDLIGWLGSDGPPGDERMRRLGGLEEVREVVLARRIDLLICAPAPQLGSATVGSLSASVAEQCLDLPVRLIAANELYEETFGHVPVGMIDAAWYRYIMHPRFRAAAPFSKRLFDLVLATLIGLACLPLVVAAAIAIKLGDRGPVLYRQRRLGEYGREFEILKLRTMRTDAERDGPRWSVAGDERVTRVGRALRRTHLDEVPQLWNVLQGEMTLVGPRPERPELVTALERRLPHYTRRHLVKPGVTGWAALRCGYAGSEIGTAWKLCHDLFYIKRRSVLVDAMIIVETAVELFRNAHRALRAPDARFLIREEPHG